MEKDKKISSAVIKRLPRYYRYLRDLHDAGVARISSKELSEKMSATASQVRQDLNCFGGFGQQGYGYNVEHLYKEIGNILKVDKGFNYIIVGAGNMGKALSNYDNFSRRGYKLVGVFDTNNDIIGKKINGFIVEDFKNIEKFLSENDVHLAMLCVPNPVTQEVVGILYKNNVKGFLNFSSKEIVIAKDAVVENVHLSDSLMILGYKLGQ